MPLALLSVLKAFESPLGNPRFVAQKDRRQQEERREEWRGGRRVSDFSHFTDVESVSSATSIVSSCKPTIEVFRH